MVRKILKNKPLIEAIFELRWELQETAPGMRMDPHYKILIGSVYEKVKGEYPFHEQLPTATMPDEISGYIVQHRFRKGNGEWPLIQIGPGIITLNDTEGYVWEDFEKRIFHLIETLFEAYPESGNLRVNELLLRYIDAIDFNYEKSNIFKFLEEKMKISVKLHKELFEDTGVDETPLGIDLRFSFPSTRLKGAVRLRFARGKRKNVDSLIWETIVHSVGEDAPKTKEEIAAWVKSAHDLTDNWFFKIIEGDLLRRFE
ncbi:MAG: TIGR04255 family protein [Candidatus Freyarchaeota archaeon]